MVTGQAPAAKTLIVEVMAKLFAVSESLRVLRLPALRLAAVIGEVAAVPPDQAQGKQQDDQERSDEQKSIVAQESRG
jgi:hypothetical protein